MKKFYVTFKNGYASISKSPFQNTSQFECELNKTELNWNTYIDRNGQSIYCPVGGGTYEKVNSIFEVIFFLTNCWNTWC